jgi:hypothetical protein
MERDMRSFTNTGKTVFFILLLLLVGLFLTSCPTDSLLGGDSDGGGSGTPTDTRERFTISNDNTNTGADIGSYSLASRNNGLGQLIRHDTSYIPETFSAYIRTPEDTYGKFQSPPTSGTEVEVTIQLRVWDEAGPSPVVYGTSSTVVPAGTTGLIHFTVSDGIEIPANTTVRYALFISNALTAEVRGRLQMQNAVFNYNGANYSAIQTILNTTDVDGLQPIDNPENWESSGISTSSLRFSLTGILVD